ncbi:MAG: type IVB secretion system protein IcmH/DotU [Spongiibacteraceae bacterium]|nr:type IVB secretion system protein IcmH/DotU [Spongiibacteraceae bacterium]MBN4055205.1 type IVB secretion system protein IcmH/DotU [bacterium AH-315-K03]
MDTNKPFIPPTGARRPDNTVLVPTPGTRSRPSRQAPPPITHFDTITLNKGLNPLVNAASTLLTLIIKLRTTLNHENVPQLHKQLCEEISAYDVKTKNSETSQENIVAGRYLLCTVIDEIVLNTPWGSTSGWSQRSLLSLYHNETFGGEKCFVLLQRMLEAPAGHVDVLELFYLCLSLGFEGKYRLVERGHEQLEHIRDSIFNSIENHRGNHEPDLSINWKGAVTTRKGLMQYIPMWVIASCVFAALVLSYSGFTYWLYEITTPLENQLTQLIVSDNSLTPTKNPYQE